MSVVKARQFCETNQDQTGVRIGNAKYDTSPKRRGHDHQDQIAVKIGDSLPDSQTMTQTPTLRSENPRRHRRVSSYSIGSVPCSDEMLLDAGMLCSDELLLDVEMSSEASLPVSVHQGFGETFVNPYQAVWYGIASEYFHTPTNYRSFD